MPAGCGNWALAMCYTSSQLIRVSEVDPIDCVCGVGLFGAFLMDVYEKSTACSAHNCGNRPSRGAHSMLMYLANQT